MEKLFKEWQNRHFSAGNRFFIEDGIINSRVWNGQKTKICFFLKEAYQDDRPVWDMTKWLRNEDGGDGAVIRMWHTVAELTYGLQNTTKSYIPPYHQAKSLTFCQRSDLLQGIAVVNVKKSNGNSASRWDDLAKYAVSDADLLTKQIELISPDVIVCGNTGSLLRIVYGAEVDKKGRVGYGGSFDEDACCFMRENGYVWLGNRLIIDFYHPANQFPKMMNYYTLCCIYQKALCDKN